ncbi:hypothetical protein LTS18_001024, partial [Coniosporium uncinatum]
MAEQHSPFVPGTPVIYLDSKTVQTGANRPSSGFGEPADSQQRPSEDETARRRLERSGQSYASYASVPPPGSILTGKQEH